MPDYPIDRRTRDMLDGFYRWFYPTYKEFRVVGPDRVLVYHTDWQSPTESTISGALRAIQIAQRRKQ